MFIFAMNIDGKVYAKLVYSENDETGDYDSDLSFTLFKAKYHIIDDIKELLLDEDTESYEHDLERNTLTNTGYKYLPRVWDSEQALINHVANDSYSTDYAEVFIYRGYKWYLIYSQNNDVDGVDGEPSSLILPMNTLFEYLEELGYEELAWGNTVDMTDLIKGDVLFIKNDYRGNKYADQLYRVDSVNIETGYVYGHLIAMPAADRQFGVYTVLYPDETEKAQYKIFARDVNRMFRKG